MALHTHYTEHSGAKNGGGLHGTRLEAKTGSKVGRRRADAALIDEGLDEIAEAERAVAEKAREEHIIASGTITADLVTQGDLYIVSEYEAWEPLRQRLMTVSLERAVAKFNELATDPKLYSEAVRIASYRKTDEGDFEFCGHLDREWVGKWLRVEVEE